MATVASKKWRVLVCDLAGEPIENISTLARNKKMQDTLNQPSSFSFDVDASDMRIRRLHTDGVPVVEGLRRVVKAYRYERQPDNSYQYVLRFAGRIWSVQDVGDENTQTTTVTCFDPLQMLERRLCRGSDYDVATMSFNQDGTQMIKDQVDRTNFYAGSCGLTTSGGTFESSAARTVDWRFKKISEALSDLSTASPGFDVRVDPRDSTDSYHGVLNVLTARGSVRSNTILSWSTPAATARTISRMQDPKDVGNIVYGVGSSQSGAEFYGSVYDSTSIGNYGAFESVAQFSDVNDAAMLTSLTTGELISRRPPQEAFEFKPALGGPLPWDDFTTGDTVRVIAGAKLRGGFDEQLRVFGWTLTISDEGIEELDSVVTGSDE